MKAFRLLFALVLLLPLHALHAQIVERALMSVDIPFSFTVENTHLPAGRYVVYSELNHEWRLSSFGKGGSAFFHVIPDHSRDHVTRPRLIFNRYETEFVLREIHPSNVGITAWLPAGKTEKELARRTAQPELAVVYAGNADQGAARSDAGRE